MEILRKLLGLKPRKRRFRSSITGRFVSKAYADANPDTTQGEKA